VGQGGGDESFEKKRSLFRRRHFFSLVECRNRMTSIVRRNLPHKKSFPPFSKEKELPGRDEFPAETQDA